MDSILTQSNIDVKNLFTKHGDSKFDIKYYDDLHKQTDQSTIKCLSTLNPLVLYIKKDILPKTKDFHHLHAEHLINTTNSVF